MVFYAQNLAQFLQIKTQNVNFEWILGPNDPFRLFAHNILCPTGPIEEEKSNDTLPLNTLLLDFCPLTFTLFGN